MDRGDSFPLPSDDVMLGLSALDEDFPLLDQADEPFLSALVDNWPDLQHEQVGCHGMHVLHAASKRSPR